MGAFHQDVASHAARVEALRQALAAGDEHAFAAALAALNAIREPELMTGVRKVACDLQAALEQFRSDSRLVDLAERQVPDARQRLAHVLKLTDEAAHRTMDLVEQSCPLVDAVAREATRLLASATAPSGPAGAEHRAFLDTALASMQAVRGRLTEVLLAQGYQDLSGQIIRGVMKLVDELELALGTLVRIGKLQGAPLSAPAPASAHGFGPVVPGVSHGNTVNGQQDVDAMLSGLGM